jgi:hypothetical protein
METTNKGPFTHCRAVHHVSNQNRLIKLFEKALEYNRKRSPFAPVDRALEKLRVATLSMRCYDSRRAIWLATSAPKSRRTT